MAESPPPDDEPRGPHALSGEAAAQEEASAQQRLLQIPAPAPAAPPQQTGWRARAREFLETVWPSAAITLFSPQPEGLPAGFEPRLAVVAAHSEDECPICLARLGPCVATPCGHSFHAACLEHYFNQSRQPGQRSRCPLCRASVHAPLPIEARAVSGLPIEVMCVPAQGGRCHFDRPYRFLHLGDFANRPSMLYVLTSNEDRRTPSSSPMWILEARVPCTVHLNFRSERHVLEGNAAPWLERKGFVLSGLRSTCSSGIPNGPYVGPVYSKACEPGTIELMGSNTWEGVYFVFVETTLPPSATEPPRGQDVAAANIVNVIDEDDRENDAPGE